MPLFLWRDHGIVVAPPQLLSIWVSISSFFLHLSIPDNLNINLHLTLSLCCFHPDWCPRNPQQMPASSFGGFHAPDRQCSCKHEKDTISRELCRAGMQEFIDTVGSKMKTLQTFACLTFSVTLERFLGTAWRKTQTFPAYHGERFYPGMDLHCSWMLIWILQKLLIESVCCQLGNW